MKVGSFHCQDGQLIRHRAFKTFWQCEMFDSGAIARQTFDDFLGVSTYIVIRIFEKVVFQYPHVGWIRILQPHAVIRYFVLHSGWIVFVRTGHDLKHQGHIFN